MGQHQSRRCTIARIDCQHFSRRGHHDTRQSVLDRGRLCGRLSHLIRCSSRAATGPATTGSTAAQPVRDRSGVARSQREPLRRFLQVRLRRLDGEASRASRSAALWPIRRTAGPQQRDSQGHPRERREAWRFDITQHRRRHIAGTEEGRRLLRQLHGGNRDRVEGNRPARARPHACRGDQDHERHPGSRRPHAHRWHERVLRIRLRARLQGRDPVHADLRPGRTRSSGSRLLLQGRRELGQAAAAVRGARLEDAAAWRRRRGGGRGRGQGGHANRDGPGQKRPGPRRAAQPDEHLPQDGTRRREAADAEFQHVAVPRARRGTAGRQRQRDRARVSQGR